MILDDFCKILIKKQSPKMWPKCKGVSFGIPIHLVSKILLVEILNLSNTDFRVLYIVLL